MSDINFKDFLNVHEFETKLSSTGKTLKFKPITVGQLKRIITKQADDINTQEQIIDDLICSCVIDEDFNIDDIYLLDRTDLLVDIRRKSLDNMYEFTTTCQKCKSQILQSIDLYKLPFIEFEDVKKNDEIEVNDNIKIVIGHIKRGEQKEAFKHIDFNNKSELESMADMGFAISAVSIKEVYVRSKKDDKWIKQDGINFDDKLLILENLDSRLYSKISEFQEKNSFGIQVVYDVTCPHCKHSETVDVPISSFFL